MLCLILAKDDEDRAQQVKDALKSQTAVRLSGPAVDRDTLKALLEELSLFGTLSPIHIAQADRLPADVVTLLEESPIQRQLVLEASDLPTNRKLYKLVASIGQVIKIEELKPWEKQAKLKLQLEKQLAAEKRSLSPELLELLSKTYVSDRQGLANELAKLKSYSTKPQITLADFQAIGTLPLNLTSFQLVDLILARDVKAIAVAQDLLSAQENAYSLFAAISSGLSTKKEMLEIMLNEPALLSTRFAYLKGQLLQKQTELLKKVGLPRLERGLQLVFEAELEAKNSFGDVDSRLLNLILKLIA